MATVYKTPGVYVEEIPKLPPSIAEVETAIPAFIGYTEKADKIAQNDLINIPTRLSSMVEYQLYFGSAPASTIDKVIVDGNGNFKSAVVTNTLFMYDSLSLFFNNGGGDCYIVSVGLHSNPGKSKTDFLDGVKGLRAIEKEDEPTLLIFPDNSLFTAGNDYYEIYQQALLQCDYLGDRFAIMDVKKSDYLGSDFRNNIGMTSLKYGAVYSPWLKILSSKEVKYSDFKNGVAPRDKVFLKENTPVTLSALAGNNTDPGITAQITKIETAIADNEKVKAEYNTVNGAFDTLEARYDDFETTTQTTPTVAALKDVMSLLFSLAASVDILTGATAASVSNDNALKTAIGNQISLLVASYTKLISYDEEAVDPAKLGTSGYTTSISVPAPSNANWGTIFTAPPVASAVISGADDASKITGLLPLLRKEFDTINSIYENGILAAAASTEKEVDRGLTFVFPTYKNIIDGIKNTPTVVPPSGAVAGIYALTDNTRGVWKAPANTSVLGILGPDATFKKSELENLNVDAVAGKSINAIRPFTGKGTLVFGARTLAGNDNEWRYISVRRFFNMVEESTKNATGQFVFEPNDANTWVKVQGMIENFLTTLWRQGALQGAKPEHAFYVAVGLGKTMTALDILEGRMIIEIGMAVVRPAEFIILQFSHKMAES